MLSSKLWAAREAILKKPGATPEVKNRLMKLWELEARECVAISELGYSVLPWELYLKTRLGLGVTLLYTSELFCSEIERKRCADAVGVPEKALAKLYAAGRNMRLDKEVPKVELETEEVLNRIVSSTYFNTERSGSLVLPCLDDMLRSADKTDHHSLKALRQHLGLIYNPGPSGQVFGFYSWEMAKYGLALDSYSRLTDAISKGTMNVDQLIEKMNMSAERWPACLTAIEESPFLRFLLCLRAPRSIAPHSYALLDCIEHTWLWMLESKIHVYSTVPDVAYFQLQGKGTLTRPRLDPHPKARWLRDKGVLLLAADSETVTSMPTVEWEGSGPISWEEVELAPEEQRMLRRYFEGEVLPRVMEKELRQKVIVGYLMNDPKPMPPNIDIPVLIREARCMYMDGNFNPALFPKDTATAVVRDEQDMDEETKMNCWLWGVGFNTLHLHRELLIKGGMDEDAEGFECGLIVEEEEAQFCFKHRNNPCEFPPDSAWNLKF